MMTPRLIIGPCTLESMQQMQEVAKFAKSRGLTELRAPVYKARTWPTSFQGLGEKSVPVLEYLQSCEFKLVTEVLASSQLPLISDYASMIQIGARNMQNFELLKEIGKAYSSFAKTPEIMLKRGFGNNLDEWLGSLQYLVDYGVPEEKILLCERGSRSALSPQGVCLDLSLALQARRSSGRPVLIDPSHGTRERSLVLPMAHAALAMGFDGIMLEVHPRPDESVSDSQQAISLEDLGQFLTDQEFPRTI